MAYEKASGIDWKLKVDNNFDVVEAAELIELASNAEVIAGTETTKGVTPAGVMAALAALAFPIAMTKVTSFAMGTLSSANDTSGVALSNSKTKAMGVNADTGGAALTAGFERAIQGRFLIGTAISSGADISMAGIEGLLKMIASVNVTGNQGGIMGHLETAGTLTMTGTKNTVKAGVASFLDIATGGTVAAGTIVSAFGVNPANFGTLTGRASIIHVTNPMAGTWSSFLDISDATGLTQAAAAGATADKHLKVYVDGVLYTIEMKTA